MLALPKGNGFDEVVRYTELGGVHCPSSSDRTLLNPSPKNCSVGNALLRQLSNQSDHLPAILEPVPFTTGLAAILLLRYLCVARSSCPHLKRRLILSPQQLRF